MRFVHILFGCCTAFIVRLLSWK